MFSEENLVKNFKQRGKSLLILFSSYFFLLFVRLWYLQIIKGDELNRFSLENSLKKEVIRPLRGLFFSRDGKTLLKNSLRFDVVLIPQYLKKRHETFSTLSSILNIDVEDLEQIYKKNRGQALYLPIVLKKNISNQEVALIESHFQDLPGIQVKTFIGREYPLDQVGVHLLGHIQEISKKQLDTIKPQAPGEEKQYSLGDFIGQTGIEAKFEEYLKGEKGLQYVEVDAQGRMKKKTTQSSLLDQISSKEVIHGNHLVLTLDYDLQQKAKELLHEKEGSIVAVSIKTGEILAYASSPSFDPSDFINGISNKKWQELDSNPKRPLVDRLIQSHYPPGSTFKIVTAIAALEENIITDKTTMHCSGSFSFGTRTYHCWQKHGHGSLSLSSAIQESCNIFFYKVAAKMDIDVLAHYAKMLGLGEKTNIDLFYEIPGLIPTKQWKEKTKGTPWQAGETLSCAIGQSFVLATPLQMAMLMATIANDGLILRPQIVKTIFNSHGDIMKTIEPELKRKISLSESTLLLIKKALYNVVNGPRGTAFAQKGRGIEMAGKTGTAQNISFNKESLYLKCSKKEYQFRHHGIFVAMAPYRAPKIAISVVIEHGCGGSQSAAPLAKELIETYMKKYHPIEHEEIIQDEKILFKHLSAPQPNKSNTKVNTQNISDPDDID